jgi:prevent-host-death family protein
MSTVFATAEKQIGAFEAKNTLGTLLDRVEAGEEITITRRGKPVARLVSVNATRTPKRSREEAEALVARFRALREGIRLDGLTVRELIDEGRA